MFHLWCATILHHTQTLAIIFDIFKDTATLLSHQEAKRPESKHLHQTTTMGQSGLLGPATLHWCSNGYRVAILSKHCSIVTASLGYEYVHAYTNSHLAMSDDNGSSQARTDLWAAWLSLDWMCEFKWCLVYTTNSSLHCQPVPGQYSMSSHVKKKMKK